MLFRELTMEEFADIRAREAYGDGRAEGEKLGLERGRNEGAANEKREIAKNMKARQIDLKTIFEITGLPLAEIEAL